MLLHSMTHFSILFSVLKRCCACVSLLAIPRRVQLAAASSIANCILSPVLLQIN